jgi:hypothetical protein
LLIVACARELCVATTLATGIKLSIYNFCLPILGVGKSCLLLRFSDGSFTTSFITTIGYVV